MKKKWTILALRLFLLGIFVLLVTEVYFLIEVRVTNIVRLQEIKAVDERSYRVFKSFINDIHDKTNWGVVIISGLRSKEKQLMLQRENPSNASVNKSRHVLGRAIDINLYQRNGLRRIWLKKFNSKRDWRNTGVVKIAAKYKLLWGGTYRSYHDTVHFEIN